MRKLHLVGLTTDRDGLIFTARKGSKSGGYIVPLDDKVLSAIASAREGGNGTPDEGAVTVPEVPKRLRSQSALTPREMQARLRAGRSIEEVAAEAGVDTEWVARFAVPILAEQAQVVELARSLVYAKPRLGESSQPLGASVVQNLSDRGVFLTDDMADAGWSAFQLHDSVWMVRFRYRSRGRDQEAHWEIDVPAARLVARNRHASDLGYVDPHRRRRDVDAEEALADDDEVSAPPPPRRTANRTPRRAVKAAPATRAAKGTTKRAATAVAPAKAPSRSRSAARRPAPAAKAGKAAKTAKAGKGAKAGKVAKPPRTKATPAVAKAAKAAKAPTRRRPAKAVPASEGGPTPRSGGVRQAVAQVSTARVAASLASADREPWAAAVRRPPRAAPASRTGTAPAAARRERERERPVVVDFERPERSAEPAEVPPFRPRPLPAGGDPALSSRVRRVTVPRSPVPTDELPAVSIPARRPRSPRPEPLPLERPKRRRLRSR